MGHYPALLAMLTSVGGEMVALHRTYLTLDGDKADVPVVKKLTPACGPLKGACIRLGEARAGVIGVAEGIETALAAAAGSNLPVVAAYCASNLASWQWPACARRIVVFADADKAGHAAADALRMRALRTGVVCEVHAPSQPDADWADVWAQRIQEGAA